MRIPAAFLILFFTCAVHAEEICPSGQWTNEISFTEGCEGIKCFRRELSSPTHGLCASIIYTIAAGATYFSSKIVDPAGAVRARERFHVNPKGKGHPVLRVDIMDSEGKLLYYLDKKERARLPSGKALPESVPNPAGSFYEMVTAEYGSAPNNSLQADRP